MLATEIKVKTDTFDGPLGLLLFLVQQKELDLKEISLTDITKQYLDYLEHIKNLNFNVAGEYLYLAATLILLKSKSFISPDEMEELADEFGDNDGLRIESQEELLRRLERLQSYQKMGRYLWSLPKRGHQVFTKPRVRRKEILDSFLLPGELEKLTTAMIDLLQKQKRRLTVINKDPLSVRKKLMFLKEYLKQGEVVSFDTLVTEDGGDSSGNIVLTFISLLELARLEWVSLFQNDDNSTIYVRTLNSMQDFDVDSANGFTEQTAS